MKRLASFILTLIMVCASAFSQATTIKGTVYDATDDFPLIGASVVVAGTKIAAATDVDGQFTIKAEIGQTLEVSYVGMESASVKITSTELEIKLQPATNMLNEVIAVGYGTVRKADVAGSVSVLDSKAFSAQPITTVGEALQGRVSGVNVISSGLPGSTPKIRIRGSNSINKSNEPLYVVDGLVRESGLEGLNPEDIASMQILKDASSTAIYGSRGANGVVIITTRKGKSGESQITFDATFGISQVTHLPKIMGTKEYADALVEYYDPNLADQLSEYSSGENPGIDWMDQIFRTGNTQNYKLVFTKGTEGLQAYVSANYMKDRGVFDYSSYERFAARANLKATLTSWLDATVDVDFSHGNGHGIGDFQITTGPVWAAFNYSPSMKMYVGDTDVYNKDPYNSIMENPYGSLVNPNERRRDILNARVDLRFNICKGLTFTTSNGVDYANNYNYSFTPHNRFEGVTTSLSNGNTNRWLLQTTNNFTYIGEWGPHALTATAVWEATSATTRGMSISGTKLLTENTGWWNVGVAETKGAGNSFSKWTLMSGVARVIYNFNNRYMVTGTFRADGSSRLQNNKWSYFPSIALAWTVSNEKFWESITPIVNNFKVRTSFGIIGNQDISPYQTLALLTQTSTYYGTALPSTGYWSDRVSTPDLRWEKTKQFDVGLDFSFLNGRFDVNLDWYYKRTSDALLQTTPPYYLGGQAYYVNAGEVSNTGVDIGITAHILQGGDWGWDSSIQASYMKNKVEKLTALEPILYSGSTVSIINDALIVKEGEPIGSFYGYQWAGINADGQDTYYNKAGQVVTNPTSEDREILGKASPDFTLGWNNTVTWKNWSLNVFFNGSFGAQRLNALRYAMNTLTGNSRFVTDATWTEQVGITMADPRKYDNNFCAGESSKWIENADYCRLENLSLAYDFKRSMTGFADIRLSISAQNLFTITGYKGINPAAMSFGDVEWKKGVDMGTAPAPRSYTVGARFIF